MRRSAPRAAGYLLAAVALRLALLAAGDGPPAAELLAEAEPTDAGGNQTREAIRIRKLSEAKFVDPSYTVYYVEHLLASWVVDKSPWNAYHSGLAFVGTGGDTHTFSYAPHTTSTVTPYIIPKLRLSQPARPLSWVWPSQIELDWDNGGFFSHHSGLPSSYTDKTTVATVNGSVLEEYAGWAHNYLRLYPTFEPQEVAVRGQRAGQPVALRSSLCHDFVTNSMQWMHDRHGVLAKPAKSIFRDHIIVYAKSLEPVQIEKPEEWASVVAYFSTYIGASTLRSGIEKNFLNLRDATAHFYHLGRPLFLYSNRSYYRVWLDGPVSEYCYLPFTFPPDHANIFTAKHKLCTPKSFEDLTGSFSWWFMAYQQVTLTGYQYWLRFRVLAPQSEQFAASVIALVAALWLGRTLFGCCWGQRAPAAQAPEGKAKAGRGPVASPAEEPKAEGKSRDVDSAGDSSRPQRHNLRSRNK